MPKIAQQCTEHLQGSGWRGGSSGLPARPPRCYCGYQRPVVPMPTRPLMHAWRFLTSFCGCFERGKNPRAMPALALRQKVCNMQVGSAAGRSSWWLCRRSLLHSASWLTPRSLLHVREHPCHGEEAQERVRNEECSLP